MLLRLEWLLWILGCLLWLIWCLTVLKCLRIELILLWLLESILWLIRLVSKNWLLVLILELALGLVRLS